MGAAGRYRKRWATGTGCGIVKRAVMTHPRSEEARNLCIAMSLAAHNAWVMACVYVRCASRDYWLPHAGSRLGVAS